MNWFLLYEQLVSLNQEFDLNSIELININELNKEIRKSITKLVQIFL